MSNRNKTAGNAFELKILKLLKPLFPNILTSRYESRKQDADKIDFCYTGPYQIQCKLTQQTPSVKILDLMPEGKNIIIWGKTEKADKYFINKGEYAIMKLDLLIELLNKKK